MGGKGHDNGGASAGAGCRGQQLWCWWLLLLLGLKKLVPRPSVKIVLPFEAMSIAYLCIVS